MNNKLRLAALLGAVVLVASAATVVATHVEPEKKDGNPTCADFAPEGVEWIEFKIEDTSAEDDPNTIVTGSYTDGTITVDLVVDEDSKVFDWTSDLPVSAVVVKGGPNANLYVYDPAATADTGLHAPVNPANDKFYGLSHISFCYEEPQDPPEETCEENPDQDQCVPPEETCEENPDQEKCEPPEETCEENPDQDKCDREESVCPIDTLAAVANADGSITVSGSASGEFDLYRQIGGGDTELIGEFDGEFEYHDTDTVAGTTYTYYAVSGPAECAKVEVTAIPVFPTAVAAVAAIGLSGLGYAMMRRRK